MPARLSEDAFDAFLDSKPGWITLSTIGADGFPHSVPLGYFRHQGSIFCGVRDDTTKVRNIEANPKVSLMVESGSTMADIKGVMVQGEATVHRASDKVLSLMRIAASLRGVEEAELPTEPREGAVYIEVRPVKRISWDYGAG